MDKIKTYAPPTGWSTRGAKHPRAPHRTTWRPYRSTRVAAAAAAAASPTVHRMCVYFCIPYAIRRAHQRRENSIASDAYNIIYALRVRFYRFSLRNACVCINVFRGRPRRGGFSVQPPLPLPIGILTSLEKKVLLIFSYNLSFFYIIIIRQRCFYDPLSIYLIL